MIDGDHMAGKKKKMLRDLISGFDNLLIFFPPLPNRRFHFFSFQKMV